MTDRPVDKIKVAMVAACPFPANHGTPGAIRELSLHLARQGHEVHVVTYPNYDPLDTTGLTIHRVRLPFTRPGPIRIGPAWDRPFYDALMIGKLIWMVRRHGIQIIHAHNYESAMIASIAKWVTGRPMIYNAVTNMRDELPYYPSMRPKWLARRLGALLDCTVPKSGDVVMVLSDELKHYLVETGVSESRVLVIPPGVDVEMFQHADGAAARQRLGLSAETPVVTYTGSLDPFQGLNHLIDAMARVVAEVPQAVLLLVNNIRNDAARRELMAQAERCGIAKRLLVVDETPLSELPDFLAAADVAVVPRVSCPGYPVKLLNYMAAGKAIVSFEGSAKSLCHGYNGYVARNGDVDDMAQGILMLLGNDELRATLGRRALESIEGVYDWGTLAHGTALVYRQMLEHRGRLQRAELGAVLKRSYVPYLDPANGDAQPFLKAGPLQYPVYTD